MTRLYPYGAAEESESGEGYGRRIDISSVNNGKTYIENTQATASWGIPDGQGGYLPNEGSTENHEIDDPQALKAWGLSQLEELSKPEVIYEVEVIDLEHLAPWEGIDIGDTVRVIDREFKPAITITARVLELERNLLDKADTKVVLGNYIPSITDIISRGAAAYDLVSGTIDDAGMIKANFITSLLPRLSALFGLGSNYIDMSEERGIVITDRPTEAESTWAMQLASAGFRIASSKLPDGSWSWRTFGTGSGFTADVINAGHLRGGAVDFDLENGALTINSQLGNNAVRVVLSGSEALSIYSNNRLIGGLVIQPDGSVINIATAIRSEKPDYLGWGATLKIAGLSADEVTDPSSVGNSGYMFDGIQLQSDACQMSIVSDGLNGGLWIDKNGRVRLRYNENTSALIGFNEDGTYSIADIGNESTTLTHGAKSWMHWQEGNFKTQIMLDDTDVRVRTPTGSENIVKSFREIKQALANAGIAIPNL